jgi:hypothetical protein
MRGHILVVGVSPEIGLMSPFDRFNSRRFGNYPTGAYGWSSASPTPAFLLYKIQR